MPCKILLMLIKALEIILPVLDKKLPSWEIVKQNNISLEENHVVWSLFHQNYF